VTGSAIDLTSRPGGEFARSQFHSIQMLEGMNEATGDIILIRHWFREAGNHKW
jgi:hypothetical protein